MFSNSNMFGEEELKGLSIDVSKYSLTFGIPEEGQYFTEVENFAYTIEEVYRAINGSEKLFNGFYMRRGEVHCISCDEDEDNCGCEDRPFDFSEANSMTEYQLKQFDILKYDIQELSSGNHSCLDFLYEIFKPILEEIPSAYDTINIAVVTKDLCESIRKAVSLYEDALKAYGKNSMPNIILGK